MLTEGRLRQECQEKTEVVAVKSKGIFYVQKTSLEISGHELIKMKLKTSDAGTIQREFLETGEMSRIDIK